MKQHRMASSLQSTSSYADLVELGRRLYEHSLVRREQEYITDPRGQPIGWLLDTRMPMLFSLVGYWMIALPLGAVLSFGWLGLSEPLGVYGFWAGMTIGLAIVAVCMGARLLATSRNDARIRRFAGL